MDRSTISNYGWVIVIIVLLLVLLTAASPAGTIIMNSYYAFTDKITENGNRGLNNSYSNTVFTINTIDTIEGSIHPNHETALADTNITFSVSSELGYECTGLRVSYNGREEIINGLSFNMLYSDVVVTPIWKEFEYSKLLFSNYNEALNVANSIYDTGFANRAPVVIDGVTYYDVHDQSYIIGISGLENVYSNKYSLSKVIMGSKCTSVAKQAFMGCSNLQDVSYSSALKEIQEGAFYNCTKLTIPHFGPNLVTIDNNSFYNCRTMTGTLVIPNSVISIGEYAFAYTGNITDISFGSGLKNVGSYAFFRNTNYLSTTLPNSVETYGTCIFKQDIAIDD